MSAAATATGPGGADVLGGATTPDAPGERPAERDDHLATLQRVQAEYDNDRRRTRRELEEQHERGAQRLVEPLLPVLDAADQALAQAPDAVGPLHRVLVETLAAQGLERLEPVGQAFDPGEQHALEHVPSDGGDRTPSVGAAEGTTDTGPVVVEVLRAGYRWRGRLVRPALVRVQDAGGQEV